MIFPFINIGITYLLRVEYGESVFDIDNTFLLSYITLYAPVLIIYSLFDTIILCIVEYVFNMYGTSLNFLINE